MKIVLKRTTLLILTVVIAILSGFISAKVDSKFKAIHFSGVFQMVQNGDLYPFRQSLDIFYSKDYLIAKTRLSNFTSSSTIESGTNKVLNGNLIIDSSYVYYISKRGDKFGLAFDSLSIETGKPIKVNVDSIVQSILGAPAFFYKLKSKGKDSVSIERDETKGLLVEKYIYKRREVQEPDSLYFYFRKQPLEVSFNLKEQRKDNMYLYKARAICNATPKGTFSNVNFDVKKYEHKFEITEIDVPEAELTKIVDLFRNSIDELKTLPIVKGK